MKSSAAPISDGARQGEKGPTGLWGGDREKAMSHLYVRNLNLHTYRSRLRSENVQAFPFSVKTVPTIIGGRLRKLLLTWGACLAPPVLISELLEGAPLSASDSVSLRLPLPPTLLPLSQIPKKQKQKKRKRKIASIA